ncbi:MAG: M67 family metallopeptidase [Novosphingobium sp.]|nr:M67 family metallopeptidase [Novosphingobium sp.]
MERLLAEAEKAAPEECCGLLLGAEGRIAEIRPVANVADDPRSRFEIDPRVLIDACRAERAGGPQLVGYYHSHPAGLPEPSPCDRDQAAGDGKVWAIAGQGEVRFWRDTPDGFEALSCTCPDA